MNGKMNGTTRSLATPASSTSASPSPSPSPAPWPLPTPPENWETISGLTHIPVPTTSFPSLSPNQTHVVLPLPQEKPANDTNSYRLLLLANGLQALLVHDPSTDRAGAALDVGVGHLDDPWDVPGCAHFCEHLSFMGTKQFPKENEYQEFIQTHGGGTNAFTATSNTNYYFHVNAAQLIPALERFAPFFHSPLFSASSTQKEIQAVNSEHKKNLQSDTWRLFQLSKHVSKPGHVWSKFGSGNARSLRADVAGGLETREKLIQWWERSYGAERMGLCVYGRDSLDTLEKTVVDLFTPIPNRSLPGLPAYTSPAYHPTHTSLLTCAKSVMDLRSLDLTWDIPSQSSYPQNEIKPAEFVTHLVGHEGPGSLYAWLKARGWVLGLSAGRMSAGRGLGMFRVSVQLTREGFEHYEEVALAVHKYISLLRTSSFPPWMQDELQKIHKLNFDFLEKQPAERVASFLAGEITKPYARDRLLSTHALIKGWDESLVRELLGYLEPRKATMMLVAQDMPSEKLGSKEPWYGTDYGVHQLPDSFWEKAESTADIPQGMHLPERNAFIPEDLSVSLSSPSPNPAPRPEKIYTSPTATLWHKKDDQFLVPKAHVFVDLRSPACNVTPRHGLRTRMFGELVRDALNEYSYAATLAGLYFSAGGHSDSLELSLEGYSDKLPVFLRTVLDRLKTLPDEMQQERFSVLRQDLRETYANFDRDQPYAQADWWLSHLLRDRLWPNAVKLSELEQLTLEEVKVHARDLLGRMNVEMLVTGNLSEEEARGMVRCVEEVLGPRGLTEAEKGKERAYLLPRPSNYVLRKDVPLADDPNSSLSYYVQISGTYTDTRTRALLGLFAHIIHEPCFTELRTKEQLGYIVFSQAFPLSGTLGLRIAIQSERDPVYLESRVEAFFDYLVGHLREMSEEEFEKLKAGLNEKRLQKMKNLTEEAHRFLSAIHTGYNDFSRRVVDVEETKKLTKRDVEEFFMAQIHQSSPTRAKLSVHMRSQVRRDPAAAAGQGQRFTVDAAKALLPMLKEHELPIEEDQYFALSEPEPPLAAVREFMQGFLGSLQKPDDVVEKIMRALEEAAKQHPAQAPPADEMGGNREKEVKLSENVVVIEDVPMFQAGLLMCPAPVPVPQPPLEGQGEGGKEVNGSAEVNGTASKL